MRPGPRSSQFSRLPPPLCSLPQLCITRLDRMGHLAMLRLLLPGQHALHSHSRSIFRQPSGCEMPTLATLAPCRHRNASATMTHLVAATYGVRCSLGLLCTSLVSTAPPPPPLCSCNSRACQARHTSQYDGRTVLATASASVGGGGGGGEGWRMTMAIDPIACCVVPGSNQRHGQEVASVSESPVSPGHMETADIVER